MEPQAAGSEHERSSASAADADANGRDVQPASSLAPAAATDPGTLAANLRERRKESAYRKSRAQAAAKKGTGSMMKPAGLEFAERHDPHAMVRKIRAAGTWSKYKPAPKSEVESKRIEIFLSGVLRAPTG